MAEACKFLKEPLQLTDLLGPGAKFEVNSNFDEGFVHDMHDEVYGSDESDDDFIVDKDALISPWTKSFAELKPLMVAVNDLMFKRIMVRGDPDSGPMPATSRVCIRYNAFWEKEQVPFDSSYLRNSDLNFYTGCGTVLKGLEKAVLTMEKGEESQFIISYKLLFGEMGCPPRVKPHADGLFVIQLISFNAVGDIDAEKAVSKEDYDKYAVVVPKAKEIYLKAMDFFGQGMYRNACKAFSKAVEVVRFCRLENEDEERDQIDFLVKMYTNLAVCYNKIEKPRKVCIMCREIRQLTNNKPSCKALFQEGRAMLKLSEYKKAKSLLLCAQKMEPQNNSINNELRELERRWKTYDESRKGIWQKALSFKTDMVQDEPKFDEQMISILDDFKKSNKNNFDLPMGLNSKEIETFDAIAKKFDMVLELDPNSTTYSIRKK